MLDLAAQVGQAVVYGVEQTSRASLPVVRELMMVLLGIEAGVAPGGGDAYWLQLQATKTDNTRLIATVLVDDPLLTPSHTSKSRVLRYIYQEGDTQPIEYINRIRGGAVTTQFGLLEHFFPVFEESDVKSLLFPDAGSYLGVPIKIQNRRKVSMTLPNDVLRLELDPELLVGTGRNVRETEGKRIWEDRDYTYRRLEKHEYPEMIEAGINYFRVDKEQELWVWRQPVFYLSLWGQHLPFPEMFYRANCRGMTMFMDEPAIHMAWFFHAHPEVAAAFSGPDGAARLLEARVKESLEGRLSHYDRLQLNRRLRSLFDLGSLVIEEKNYPAWETQEWSVYYQLKAGLPGAVHEGRYTNQADVNVINSEYDVYIPDTPTNNFRIRYAWFRGAARMFDGEWGTAIYGQCEESIAPQAMTDAYDMGARYVWFWTSDKGHHMPYAEQLELAAHLRDHAKQHPRAPLDQVRRRAHTAILLPDGYTLSNYSLWGTHVFHLDRVNQHGLRYRDVLHPAALQIERCIENDIAFDLIYDDGSDGWQEYDEAIKIDDQGNATWFKKGALAGAPPLPETNEPERSVAAPHIVLKVVPDDDDDPLTVTLVADIDNRGKPPGLRSRDWGTPNWTTIEAFWTIYDDPIEPAFAIGDTVNHVFPKPGSYKVTAWTCNEHGRRAEATTHVLVK